MKKQTYFKPVLGILSVLIILPVMGEGGGPWRLDSAVQSPAWFSLSGSHRTRLESLDGQYRGGRDGGDQALMFRTLVKAELNVEQFKFVGELQDSRVELADAGTPISTSMVNPLELLQAYAEYTVDDLFTTGSKSRVRAGRITMDIGSRRLVARNRFRNTLNAFTGVDWQWNGSDGSQLRAFYTLPIQRVVDGNPLENDQRFDREHEDIRFWGVYYSRKDLPRGNSGEVYLFGLDEEDVVGRATRNRDLTTLGFRIYKKPAKNAFDYQLESIFQWGDSRLSTAAGADLDHWAHFHHLELGYTFDAPMTPQLLFQYDYAGGDHDRADGDNNRFDTLFGARRFDFGPTSIYGPFARSNLSTPGLRVRLKPAAAITSFVSLRGFWLEDSDDAWPTARISGAAGVDEGFVGTQIEVRVRWEPRPKNLRIEAGVARLFAGEFMENAGKGDASYLYTQAVFRF